MESVAVIDHRFVVAAYTVTWVLQLGYLAWLAFKWRAEKARSARHARDAR